MPRSIVFIILLLLAACRYASIPPEDLHLYKKGISDVITRWEEAGYILTDPEEVRRDPEVFQRDKIANYILPKYLSIQHYLRNVHIDDPELSDINNDLLQACTYQIGFFSNIHAYTLIEKDDDSRNREKNALLTRACTELEKSRYHFLIFKKKFNRLK